MQYPSSLTPIEKEIIALPSGKTAQIPKTRPIFDSWKGNLGNDNYGSKPVLCYKGKPFFAELIILEFLKEDGWNGVWVDTFRHKYRTSYWPNNEIVLPSKPEELLQSIYHRAGSTKGCWDVFCWKEDLYLFAESKRHDKDRIRDTQKRWLDAALVDGLPLTSFLLVEWSNK